MINIQKSTWAEMKASVAAKSLSWQHETSESSYYIYAIDDKIFYSYMMLRSSPASGEQAEWEASFMPLSNVRTSQQMDSDGAYMSRTKVAPSGWNFNLRMIELATSSLDSVYNKNTAGTSLTDAVLKLYDADNVLITDPLLAPQCVKTILDIEPPYDIYVAGGSIKFTSAITDDLRVSVIAVPDVPAAYGGTKEFVQNINMKYMSVSGGVNADGRAAKWLKYDANMHTNKLRFQFTHPAGLQVSMGIITETYKQ